MARSSQAAPVLSSGLNLLSAWFCPFAQRTWIALEEKGVPYAYHEVTLKNENTGQWYQFEEKPDWWLKLNPLGKVPVLVIKEDGRTRSVYESNICNEFLEDYDKKSPLLPSDPVERAHGRIIVDRFSRQLMPLFYKILVNQDKEMQEECRQNINKEVKWLESKAHPDGPWFLGKDFTLVDVALVPWFLRQPILEHYRGLGLPEDSPRLHRWISHAKQRPSVQATEKHPEGLDYSEELLKHYSKYADASAKSTSAHDFK